MVLGSVVIGLVARPAVKWYLVSVGMALNTLQLDVRPGKRKLRIGMIEGRWLPGRSIVALRAIVTEIILRVVRVRRAIVIVLVAGITCRGRIVITSGMT